MMLIQDTDAENSGEIFNADDPAAGDNTALQKMLLNRSRGSFAVDISIGAINERRPESLSKMKNGKLAL
jgi:hypothetical protein